MFQGDLEKNSFGGMVKGENLVGMSLRENMKRHRGDSTCKQLFQVIFLMKKRKMD